MACFENIHTSIVKRVIGLYLRINLYVYTYIHPTRIIKYNAVNVKEKV